MGATFNTGYLQDLILYNASNNIGIGIAADATYKVKLGGSLSGTSATFSGNLEVFNSGAGQTAGDFIVNPTTKYVYVGRQSTTSGDNTTFVVRDRTGAARATIPGGGSVDTVFSTNSSNFKVTNYSGTDLLSISNTGAATFSSSVTANSASLKTSGALNLYVTDNSNYAYIQNSGTNSGTNNIGFYVSGASPDLFIKANGSVGIGTSSPSVKLQVEDSSSTSLNTLYLVNSSTAAVTTKQNNLSFRMTDTVGTRKNAFQLTAYADSAGGNIENGGLIFSGRKADVDTEFMRITSGGRVIVGTDSSNALEVFSNGDTEIGFSYATRGNVYAKIIGDVTNASPLGGEIAFQTATGGTLYERMRITSGGNVGIGTSSPVSYSGYTTLTINNATNGGAVQFQTNGTNALQVINDTLGSYVWELRNSFLSLGTNSTERMRITSGGQLQVNNFNGAAVYGILVNTTNTTGTQYMMDFQRGGTQAGYIASTSATAVGIYNTSDYRLKSDLKDFSGIDVINAVKVYDFVWNTSGIRDNGVLAHELQSILPNAVIGEKDGTKMQAVDYSKLTPFLVKAIQELKAEIDILKNK